MRRDRGLLRLARRRCGSRSCFWLLFWLLSLLGGRGRATQSIDGSLKRVQARTHLTRPDIAPDQVADGGTYRDADWPRGKADQRADKCKNSRKH